MDLASNDAVHLSNTFMLEQKYGWRGLCVEPNPVYTAGYIHRKCTFVQAVVGPRDNVTVQFNLHNLTLGGVVGFDNTQATNETELLYTVSLERLLRDFQMPRVIDYLSLDIEGAEAWAFETFPWDAYTFLVMTVERPKPELKMMFDQRGYVYVCDHGTFGDEMWIHQRLPNFEAVRKKYGTQKECRPPHRA